ncbi:MAG: LysR substrate-binding domain-containing protein [Pseudomonadota bacterium]
MNIKHLRTLVAAVERGSFAAAGEAVGVTHSAVSLQIKALEDELGVMLFDRTTRPPAPTARGRALADHARKTLHLFDAARAVATGELVKGKLTVGAVPTTLSSILPPALTILRDHHPELRIEIRSGSSASLAADLQRGQLDIAICTRPDPSPPGLEWHQIVSEPFHVIAPVAFDGDTDKDLLTTRPFIWFNRKSWAGRGIEAQLDARGITVASDMEVDSLDAIASLVSAGLGISIVPMCKGARPLPSGVRAIPFGDPPYTRDVGALIAPDGAPSGLIDTFLTALRSI